jgi:DNA helicase-2/ATP-dependent DNA helicase PcrA
MWPLYREALERRGVVDFDDQVRRAIDVLLTQPAARRAAQRACRVLLVDEFQDLTPAHLLLVRLLTGQGGAVFGVGDDDQTIYGYNGADPGWLIDFSRWFVGAGDHPLEVNYRCPGGVVEIADRLLRHNRRRVAKTIRAASASTGGWSVDTSDDPVAASRTAVRAALAGGAAPADVAVLTRVNATLAPVQVALAAEGIPTRGGVGIEFVDRTAIRATLAWLRLAMGGGQLDPDDIGEALRRPSRSLHPRVREWVVEQRSVDALRRLAGRVTNEKDSGRIDEFADAIERLRAMASSGAPTARLLAVLVDEIGLGGAVATLDANRRGMNRTAQGDDLLALRQLGAMHPDPATFEGWLRESLQRSWSADGVVLATVHRVKGQEWPWVVVHLADAEQFPHRLALDREEERRLFHVAITRASRHVTVVAGERPSPFVAELTTEPPAGGAAEPSVERRPAAPPRQSRDTPDHPLLDRERVIAVVGLVLVDQGHGWTVVDLEPAAAVTERNGATRRFALGEKVETAGRQRGALRPRPGEVAEGSRTTRCAPSASGCATASRRTRCSTTRRWWRSPRRSRAICSSSLPSRASGRPSWSSTVTRSSASSRA